MYRVQIFWFLKNITGYVNFQKNVSEHILKDCESQYIENLMIFYFINVEQYNER